MDDTWQSVVKREALAHECGVHELKKQLEEIETRIEGRLPPVFPTMETKMEMEQDGPEDRGPVPLDPSELFWETVTTSVLRMER